MDAHLRDLRYFVAVAEELSFTRAAADRLFVSQPSLSKQIRQLERSLRTTLFDRGHRAVALTEAGAALLPRARRILADWDEAHRTVAGLHERVLTVGFQTRINRGLIPTVTAAIARTLPGWQLRFRQISWADPTTGLSSGDVDVAIAWLPVPPGYASKTIRAERRWVALRADHPLAAVPEVPFADLTDQPFVALPTTAGALRDHWLATDQRRTPARVTATATTSDEAWEAVASGLGVLLLAEGNVAAFQRDEVLCRPVTGLPDSHLAVVWREADTREAVRVFVDASCLCV
ncbi:MULTISPECIES: LysR substrate-binding domain-containing protein [Actinoplanes]|uniref:LysR family transcriptional regulator n=1 Tax=Actinoplanes TaxID=1865 RepID=UPI0005F2AE65|nr:MULTISPECIES: LysR substrate-binding domain-containing protein [Actinoplanes]GLY04383.1 LysR family transcriptional regulator [Actinoplanes sp. NBRC 101535]